LKLYSLTAHEVGEKLRSGEISSVEVLDSVYGRIDEVEPKLNSFITLTKESAYRKAKSIDERRAAGETLSDLAGVPGVMKDNMCTNGVKTTCGSKILHNFIPPYDATVVNRLNEEGFLMVGKANMDEFAMGSSNENSAYGLVRNPWDLERVPGGSSGGSAVTVAADEAYFSLGSDTGGSIRQPAALCGLVGMKPTYGLVSRYGLVAFASSLDQIGPFTKDVEDCALVMNAVAGHDPNDSTSLNVPKVNYKEALNKDIKDMRIGIPREYFEKGIDPAVRQKVMEAVKVFELLGAKVEETSLPYSEHALPVYYIAASAEASSNLARYDGIRYGYRTENLNDLNDLFVNSRSEGFGAEVKRRIMLGTYALSSGYYDAYYKKALQVRTLIKQDFDRVFEKYDVLLSPTSPCTAFKIGEKVDDPLAMYMSDICTVPVNIAGIPALSMPCGLVDGLPVGLQIIGPALGETAILRAAHAYESASGFKNLKAGL